MGQYERLILMAEDELTEYSTEARKIEKLRRKIALSLSLQEQKQVKEALLAQMPKSAISQLVKNQRQTVALPFWGIAGLGLLLGISLAQPLDYLAAVFGGVGAIAVQKWGWKLQAQDLILRTLEELEQRSQKPAS